jgi:hypothetical protein
MESLWPGFEEDIEYRKKVVASAFIHFVKEHHHAPTNDEWDTWIEYTEVFDWKIFSEEEIYAMIGIFREELNISFNF